MDWAKMVMQMYKLWAQRKGYKVTVVDEMPGEIAGIKVQFFSILFQFFKKCMIIYTFFYYLRFFYRRKSPAICLLQCCMASCEMPLYLLCKNIH